MRPLPRRGTRPHVHTWLLTLSDRTTAHDRAYPRCVEADADSCPRWPASRPGACPVQHETQLAGSISGEDPRPTLSPPRGEHAAGGRHRSQQRRPRCSSNRPRPRVHVSISVRETKGGTPIDEHTAGTWCTPCVPGDRRAGPPGFIIIPPRGLGASPTLGTWEASAPVTHEASEGIELYLPLSLDRI